MGVAYKAGHLFFVKSTKVFMDISASQLKRSYLIKAITYTQNLFLFPKMITNF